jgi:hypothetical protein
MHHELYGPQARSLIGYLIIRRAIGTVTLAGAKVPRFMIAGEMFGDLQTSKERHLWAGGAHLLTTERRAGDYFGGYTLDQILTTHNWPGVEYDTPNGKWELGEEKNYWPDERENKDFYGLAKILTYEFGKQGNHTKYLVCGVLVSRSLDAVNNTERWSGRLTILPETIHRAVLPYKESEESRYTLEGMNVSSILTSDHWQNGDLWGEEIFRQRNETADQYLIHDLFDLT